MRFQNRRKAFYFGTLQRMQWIDTPKSGAEAGAEGWSNSGTYLNGGGFAYSSPAQHKVFNYSWPDSSSREAEETLRAYRTGVYGTGLIYTLDPLYYDRNILPEAWAAPFVGPLGGPLLVNEPRSKVSTATRIGAGLELPIDAVTYPTPVMNGGGPRDKSLMIPVPPGFTLYLSGIYSSTSSTGGVMAQSYVWGKPATISAAKIVPKTLDNWVQFHGTDSPFVRLFLGDTASGKSTTVHALVGRLAPTPVPAAASGTTIAAKNGPAMLSAPWCVGSGHSGLAFDGDPTRVEYTGVNGGQVGYAASFREVGDWLPWNQQTIRPTFRRF